MASNNTARYASDFPVDTVVRDYCDPESGLRFLVVRGFVGFCAYVGVQADHTLAGLAEFRFDCHYGVNFRTWGRDGTCWEPGWYWWGWDYSHGTDMPEFADEPEVGEGLPPEMLVMLKKLEKVMTRNPGFQRKRWTADEVTEDAMDVLMSLKEQLRASEELAYLALPKGIRG